MSRKQTEAMAKRAHAAAYVLSTLSAKKRNQILKTIATYLEVDASKICKANRLDLKQAKRMHLSQAMLKRLELTPAKVKRIAQATREVINLPDPVGRVLETTRRPNGLRIEKISVPIGVLLIIYESRPNVTADCAALGIKSGNCVILKGGKEAFHSNRALHASIRRALLKNRVPTGIVEWVPSTDRETVHALLRMNQWIQLVIPRGGEALIRKVAQDSTIPVIKHYKGVCHVYVDRDAKLPMALAIAENAKVQNPGVCNTMETLLVHRDIAKKFLLSFQQSMRIHGVELRGCARTRKILTNIKLASDADWSAEYLDMILAIRVVDNLDDAINHIHRYGSAHTDAIVSQNKQTLESFAQRLDSACVFKNASTRFSDGGEFGMGAEIGISTDKLHARGPMGLRELTTYKYVVSGQGQVRT